MVAEGLAVKVVVAEGWGGSGEGRGRGCERVGVEVVNGEKPPEIAAAVVRTTR